MGAWEMPLEEWLQDAVMLQAVTLQEAWTVQDAMLLSQAPLCLLPKSSSPVLQRLWLVEAEPESQALH